MPDSAYSSGKLLHDLSAGLVVFLVALPLCLGVAIASDAPPIAGVLSGIIGGIVVGLLSGSHTSVSGAAPSLTAVIATQVLLLGSFEAFLLAVFIAGLIQIALGLCRAGFLSAFFPSSVIKGLLAAIGVILILKQVPHVLGYDADPDGEMSFDQPKTNENTFTALYAMLEDLHPGAAVIGVASILLLVAWEMNPRLKRSSIPAPLVVVVVGILLYWLLDWSGGFLQLDSSHLVNLDVTRSVGEFLKSFQGPDWDAWNNPAVYSAAVMIAVVASLESLLNLTALDKLDPRQRVSPPNRELLVQGIGNCIVALIGGIPMTAGVVRGSVNIDAGAQSKLSTIWHGVLLAVSVVFLAGVLNQVPLSCLAAILVVTGAKLASPALMKGMWNDGPYQFFPFMVTLVSIVLTNLVTGILIGMAASIMFILRSNLRRPLRRVVEKHLGGEVLNIQLASQVSFLNRAALEKVLREVPRGGHVLLDASNTDYIDPDVLALIRDFTEQIAPAHGVQVSLRGFRKKYHLQDTIQFADYSTRELQDQLTAAQVLQILREGNERFRTDNRLTRDFGRQLDATAKGQHPLAVVLSCIDSRTPAELVLDLGLGDIFSVRVAGNVIGQNVLGSLEYGCAVAGAKLILVMGHTRCGAVTSAVDLVCSGVNPEQATGCQHLEPIVRQIQQSVDAPTAGQMAQASAAEKAGIVDAVARRNVLRTVRQIILQSQTLSKLVREERIAVVGALYDVQSGMLELLADKPNAGEHGAGFR
jgi:carbonic anhydrase/SulP family sulfate permease